MLCQLLSMMIKVMLFSMKKAKLLILKPPLNIGVHNYSKWNKIKTHTLGLPQL